MNKAYIVIAILIAASTSPPQALQAQAPAEVIVVAADSIQFRPHPTEKDARMAVLFGNPAEAGYFLMRIEFPPGWTGPPHMHPNAELLMVRSGACYVATGHDLSREAATELPPGSFAAVPARTPMRGFAGEEPCVVDVQGQGPFTAGAVTAEE